MNAGHKGRRTAAVLAATAAVLATVLTPANAQSPTAPGKPAITYMKVEHPRPDCAQLVFKWSEPDDGGSAIIGYDVRVTVRPVHPGGTEVVEWRYPGQSPPYSRLNKHGFTDRRFATTREADIPETPVLLLEFGVRAWNSVGAGPWLDTARYEDFHLVTCAPASGDEGDVGPPTVPLSVSAIPGDGYVTLSWNRPASDGGSPVTAYEVGYRRAGRTRSYYTRTTAATSIKITGLVNEADYELFVRARNIQGASSWTETLVARPVGSEGSEIAAELIELVNFLDELLGQVDQDETPVEPVAEDCPRGTKYNTESRGWVFSKTRYRIVASESWTLSDGTRINRGDAGGEIKYDSLSLSQHGCSWVFPGSKIQDSAQVRNDAIVKGNAIVTDMARVFGSAQVDGDARVSKDARVYGNATVSGNAKVYGKDADRYARVYGYARVYRNAEVYDEARVYGRDDKIFARVYGDAKIYDAAEVHGDARVYGNARVHDNAKLYGSVRRHDDPETYVEVYDTAEVFGNAEVYEQAKVYENARVYGNSRVCGKAEIFGNAHVSLSSGDDDCKIRGNARIFGEMQITSGVYDGSQEFKRDAERIFQDQYDKYYSELEECDVYDSVNDLSIIHKDALAITKGKPDDVTSAVRSACSHVERLISIGRVAAPSGWDFILEVAGTFSWPARIGIVLDLATLVNAVDTLDDLRREFGRPKVDGAVELNDKLWEAYQTCTKTGKDDPVTCRAPS